MCMCIVLLFCTYLTFDLILRHRYIFRLGIHPYRFYYTYRNIFSMDASFYLILPSEVFFFMELTANKAIFYVKPPWVGGTIFLFAASGSHDQDGHHAHIWSNPSKIFFSRTGGPIFTKLGM